MHRQPITWVADHAYLHQDHLYYFLQHGSQLYICDLDHPSGAGQVSYQYLEAVKVWLEKIWLQPTPDRTERL